MVIWGYFQGMQGKEGDQELDNWDEVIYGCPLMLLLHHLYELVLCVLAYIYISTTRTTLGILMYGCFWLTLMFLLREHACKQIFFTVFQPARSYYNPKKISNFFSTCSLNTSCSNWSDQVNELVISIFNCLLLFIFKSKFFLTKQCLK